MTMTMLFPAVAKTATYALFVCIALASCSKPKVPDQEVPPDPQSTAPASLTQAINQPIDDAKAIRQATEDAASDQRQAIDTATGE